MASKRASRISPFLAMDVMNAAYELQQSPDCPFPKVLHLEVGQPSMGPPDEVLSEAYGQQLSSTSKLSLFGYTPAFGLPTLRDSLALHYRQRYPGTKDLTRENVVITTGASGAFLAIFAATFDHGNRVAISFPGYPCYRHVLRAFDIDVYVIPTGIDTDFQPSMEQLKQLPSDIDGVILASPANPTGSCLSQTVLQEIVSFCRGRNIKLIVDEIYHGITRNELPSILQFPTEDDTHGTPMICVGSMSKFWCMTGFRVGWIITRHKPLLVTLEKCLQNMAICAPTPGQHVANVALSRRFEEQYVTRVVHYFQAIDALSSQLRRAGFQIPEKIQGAFYIYAGCRQVCDICHVDSAIELCRTLLQQCAVACTPGDDFDEINGRFFIRFSCAGSFSDVTEAGDRIVDFVASRRQKKEESADVNTNSSIELGNRS